MTNNFLMGGKLGDFLHSLFAVKQISLKNKVPAKVYLYDIGWEFGIHNVYEELYPVLLSQDYIEEFHILDEYQLNPIQTPENNTPIQIHNSKLLTEGYIDLGRYIASPWLYKCCWSELYSKTFNFDITSDYKWIEHNKINKDIENKVVIHRKNNLARLNNSFPYKQIIDEYKDNIVFVSSNESDYEHFPYKNEVSFFKVVSLDDWFTVVNSCSMFVSNLTGPAVISHSLDKLRIIELPNTPDAYHCIGEEKYSSNIKWYMSDTNHNLVET